MCRLTMYLSYYVALNIIVSHYVSLNIASYYFMNLLKHCIVSHVIDCDNVNDAGGAGGQEGWLRLPHGPRHRVQPQVLGPVRLPPRDGRHHGKVSRSALMHCCNDALMQCCKFYTPRGFTAYIGYLQTVYYIFIILKKI